MSRKIFYGLFCFSIFISCSHDITGPSPNIVSIEPNIVCNEQFTTAITIHGSGFSPLGMNLLEDHPSVGLPQITLQKVSELDGTEAQGSEPVIIPDGSDGTDAHVRWTSQEEMSFDIYPELNIEEGVYSIEVRNRNGATFTISSALVVVPPPVIEILVPDIVCTADEARQITIRGQGFLKIGDSVPTVFVDGGGGEWKADSLSGCTPIPGPAEGYEICTELTFTLAAGELQPEPGEKYANYRILVKNPEPADCVTTEPLILTVVPPAGLNSLSPDIICTEQFENSITITGNGFLKINDAMPVISIGNKTYTAETLDGCETVEGPSETVQTCSSLTFTIPQGDLSPGAYDVLITNPDPAGCNSSNSLVLTVVPPPDITTVEPPYICNEQFDSTVTITGTGFLTIDGDNPQVVVGSATLTADSLAGCQPVTGPSEDVQTCTEITFTIPAGTLPPGTYDITVTNPQPPSCSDTATATIVVVPPPEITSISPDIACIEGGEQVFTVSGSGFIRDGTNYPSVNVNGTSFTADSVADCDPIPSTTDAESCTTLTFTISDGELNPGLYEVSVTNPQPANCRTGTVNLLIAGPPVINAIDPPVTCSATPPSEMTLTGENFLIIDGSKPSVLLDGTAVTVTAAQGCTQITGLSETIETCTSITFTVPSSLMTTGSHTLSVTNPPPADCLAPATFSFDVALPPTITGVVPSRVCSTGIDITVTGTNFVPSTQVFLDTTPAASTVVSSSTSLQAHFSPLPGGVYDVTVSNGTGCEATIPDAVTVVEIPYLFFVDPPVVYNGISIQITIYASGIVGNVTSVTITPSGGGAPISLTHTFDPLRPNRIIATLPSGLAVGFWDVTVTDDIGCVATLLRAFEVTDSLTLAVNSMQPPFGWTNENTSVQITSPSPPPAGYENFVATPRAYLNPHSPSPGDRAAPMKSVAFVNETLLTAVVPAGLPAGVYDLIVVNPDRAVGILENAFTVTLDPPPVIDNVTPASVTNDSNNTVTAEGKNFRSPSAQVTCLDPSGTTTTLPATVTGSNSTSATIIIPSAGLSGGTVCVLRLTNSDGTYADYSAIAVTNPSENLMPFTASTSMIVARRALCAVAGRATSTARFVYAIGGDSGTSASAMDSVEAAPVDLFGHMGTWRMLSYALPSPRTLAGVAQLGRYIYLVGGNNGTSETREVLRAKILDPDQTPEITDINLEEGTGTGLDGGVWYYRVSAIMPPTDPDNPGGETLPSDPLVVLLPSLSDKVHLTIYWIGVAGAAGYRIYRSPTPNLTSGSEVLLAEVGAGVLHYKDDGSVAPGTAKPLMIGDTGKWATMPALNGAREYPGVAIAYDAAGGNYYIYAVGGRRAGTALRTYEYAQIVVSADGSQTMGSWTEVNTNNLRTGRWQLNLFAMDNAKASRIPAGTTYIYAAGGTNATGVGAIRDVDAAIVQSGGTLGAWVAVDDMTPARAGYGYAAANNTLYVFGGQGAIPSSTNASARICESAGAGCTGGPPQLDNWNALGFNLTIDRYLMGSAVESAFIFLLGGATTGGVPTNTTESTVW